MSKKVVILGAGIGGVLAARGVKDKFPEMSVTLVGPRQDNDRPGLFYFNKKIPRIAEKEVDVEYCLIGEGTVADYQLKSRGYFDHSVTKSSFSNVGKKVKGYLLSSDINLEDIECVPMFSSSVDLKNQKVDCGGTLLTYDLLVSTIPLSNFLNLISYSESELRALKVVFTNHFRPVCQKTSGYSLIDDSQVDRINVFYDLSDSKYYRHSSYYNGQDIVKMVSESIDSSCDYDKVTYPGKIVPSVTLSRLVENIESLNNNVILCGRYARWDYHYTVDQTYEDAIKFVKDRT